MCQESRHAPTILAWAHQPLTHSLRRWICDWGNNRSGWRNPAEGCYCTTDKEHVFGDSKTCVPGITMLSTGSAPGQHVEKSLGVESDAQKLQQSTEQSGKGVACQRLGVLDPACCRILPESRKAAMRFGSL